MLGTGGRLKHDKYAIYIKLLSVSPAVIIIIIINNPRYSYKGYHLLGPRNRGIETQSDLYKSTEQMGKRQNQSWTKPYVFPACPGA